MRVLSLLITLGILAALLALTGCAKKVQQADKGTTRNGGVTHVSGTCVVCGKQSDKLVDFQVPYGPKVKVCAPDVNMTCIQKVGANPEKYGGKTSGTAPGATAPAPAPAPAGGK